MPCIKYVDRRFSRRSRLMIDEANSILKEYAAQGFDLTLRQLYYQFVARGLLANRQPEYKRLGGIINDARLAGLVDWDRISDRTRYLRQVPHWPCPSSIIQGAAEQYALDHWTGQKYRPEVWIEKDALIGVIQNVCEEFDTPYFSCRGYTSQSEMWRAGARLEDYTDTGRTAAVVLYLGDHDPSGLDMDRDINERLHLFMQHTDVRVRRVALNAEQVQRFKLPPNPAKLSDSRAAAYTAEHGRDSWELDALDPAVLVGLIRDELTAMVNRAEWLSVSRQQESDRKLLAGAAEDWESIAASLQDKRD